MHLIQLGSQRGLPREQAARGGGAVRGAAGLPNKDVQPEPFAPAESSSLVSRLSLDHLRRREREGGVKPASGTDEKGI